MSGRAKPRGAAKGKLELKKNVGSHEEKRWFQEALSPARASACFQGAQQHSTHCRASSSRACLLPTEKITRQRIQLVCFWVPPHSPQLCKSLKGLSYRYNEDFFNRGRIDSLTNMVHKDIIKYSNIKLIYLQVQSILKRELCELGLKF